MQTPPPVSDRLYNNADSFAQCFDEAWQRHIEQHPHAELVASERLEVILAELTDHPFLAGNPLMARQVAEFRIRLLGL